MCLGNIQLSSMNIPMYLLQVVPHNLGYGLHSCTTLLELTGSTNLKNTLRILDQISAKRGTDSTFAVEANTKTLCPKSSRFRKSKTQIPWSDLTAIHDVRLKYRYST